MLGIMDKELKFENIPYGYSVCFNGDCALRETCMHYLAGQLQPANRYSGHAIYPTAWKSGTCQSYREKKLVKKAWGSQSSIRMCLTTRGLRRASV